LDYYSEGYIFTIRTESGTVLSWEIEVDTPEFWLPLITAQEKPVYLYTSRGQGDGSSVLTFGISGTINIEKPGGRFICLFTKSI